MFFSPQLKLTAAAAASNVTPSLDASFAEKDDASDRPIYLKSKEVCGMEVGTPAAFWLAKCAELLEGQKIAVAT